MGSATAYSVDLEPASETVRIEHDCDETPPSLAIVEGIAYLAGVEPADLRDETGIVLFEHVEPDALDALVVGRPETDVDISLLIDDYRVSVDETSVVVHRPAE